MNSIFRSSKSVKTVLVLTAALCITPTICVNAANPGKTFASPEEAVKAFSTAVSNDDTNALANMFGPNFNQFQSRDPALRQQELARMAGRLQQGTQLEPFTSNIVFIDIGNDRWPFAIPLVQTGGSWHFDTDVGKQELQNRRIGRNELEALKSVRAYANAQRQYASKDRNGDQVLEYAQKFVSSPGQENGLYWPPGKGEISPLGPLFTGVQASANANNAATQKPFHGYNFKILTRQGKNAPGGAYDYITNGHMIGGFALVAWPAEYGKSGVMTFVINQQGKVYQKDLGPNTASIAENIQSYNPDRSWKLSAQ